MNLINMIVAQVAAQGAQDATVSTALSVWDLTLKGGWLMIPLALLLLVSIYIFFERLFATSRVTKLKRQSSCVTPPTLPIPA